MRVRVKRPVGWFKSWRRARILQQAKLDPTLWHTTLERFSFTRGLSDAERVRLHELTTLFLHDKHVHGAADMVIEDEVRIAIAVQACVLILNLGLDYYLGWTEVIVYPDEFVARREYVDEAGVVHEVDEAMSGEAWEGGPVVLSWADVQAAGHDVGYNVVIHEFAHKLDMLNGEPNGFPPLHAQMSRGQWSSAFESAYETFCDRLDSGIELHIDEYAAESPAEFFAVMSEAFFESPHLVHRDYPQVYEQLRQFYRQDPHSRLPDADQYRLPAEARV